MKSKYILLTLFLIIGISAFGLTSQASDLNPLDTERAETLGMGNLRLDVMFTVDSLDNDTRLYHLPGVRATYGISDITDLILSYGGLTMIEGDNIDSATGSGDLTVGLKVSPLAKSWGTMGFLFATKLPNASDEDGLGTDMQDFYFMGLYTYALNSFKFNLNAGVHIIGDNTMTEKYHYLFAYGVGAEYMINEDYSIVADVYGTTGSDSDYDIHEASLGIVGPLGWGWEWAVTGSVGLSSEAPDWSAGLFFSKTWGLPELMHQGPLFTDEDPLRLTYYPFPLHTKEAWTTAPDTIYAALKFEMMEFEDDMNLYSPSIDLRWGIARGVSVGIEVPYLFIEDSAVLGDDDGFGDVRLNFKLSPWQYKSLRFGLSSEVKFPTTNGMDGISRNEMDYTFLFLTSASCGKFTAHLNLGLAIEGNPTELSAQNDFFVAGLGMEYALTDWASAFGEFYGKFGNDEDLSSYQASGGLRFLLGKYSLSIFGGSGFSDSDPEWKAGIGIARFFSL